MGRIFKSVGLGGFLQESYSTLAQTRCINQCSEGTKSLCKCMYLMECQQGKSQSMATPKADISETIIKTMASDQISSDPAPECPTMASDQISCDPAPECPTMASDQLSSDPAPECQTMALNHDSLSPAIQRQRKVTQAYRTVITSNELDLLFSLMFDELLNGSSKVVSKSSAVSAADAPNQRQQYTTPLTNHTTPAPTCQIPTLAPTVISFEN
nr:hypothetical protein [Tanacetum cinerariifolium]